MAAKQAFQPLYLNRFFTGLVTQRSPLTTPFSFVGLNLIQRHDALIGGLNVEVSPDHTLQRRPGFSRYCSQALGAEKPLAFFSARLNNSIISLLDTATRFCSFTSSAITTLLTKSNGAGQTFSQQVGNTLYFSNGIDIKKWNGTTVSNLGIAAPVSGPTVQPPGGTALRFWGPGNTTPAFFALLDMNGQMQEAVSVGQTTGSTYPTFAQRTGQFEPTITDGTQTWRALGVPGTWTANQAYSGGAIVVIIDSNNNFQLSSSTGTTGATAPTWNTTPGGSTTDNTISWECFGPASTVVFNGYGYVYAYHTLSGHVSTASPASFTGPAIGSIAYTATIGGVGSADTQCNFIWIFRTADGGSSYDFLAQVANPGGGNWTYTDTTPDASLNNLIIAPLAHQNDPPPAGLTVLAFHMGRMWGTVGNLLYFAAGPDVVTGNGREAWPPANVFTFPSNITGLAPTSQGLLVFLKDQVWVILGGPQTLTFFPQQVMGSFGISSPNCLIQDGDALYFYTTSKQMFSFSIGGSTAEIGATVRDLIASTFDPVNSYIALLRNGSDVGVHLSDGSTNTLRYDLNSGAWCSIAQPIGGIGAIGTVETGFGIYGLMMGRATNAGYILERNTAVFSDDTQVYNANAIIGSLTLSQPGTPALAIESIILQYTNAGSFLEVGVLANEIAGTFTDLPITADDPWQLPPSTSLRMKRHDLKGASPALNLLMRHMQLQITMPTEAAKNEVLGISICPEIE